MRDFKLSPSFLIKFQGKQPEWGPLGYIAYKRTYARKKEDGSTEEFWETCARVVEGVYSSQKQHCRSLCLPWNNEKAQRSAQEMYHRMWDFKWLPPGRGMWMMGTDYIDVAGGAALNNCAFVSTRTIREDFAEPFCWCMDMLMLGVGVGFDTKGEGLLKVQEPKQGEDIFVVKDSREGWVDLLRRVLTAYTGKGTLPKSIDYSQVRPAGSEIKGFGGTASGFEPLDNLILSTRELLDALVGTEITSSAIVDIFNFIGRCVVAGNVRRSAEIAFGDPHDSTFLNLKNPELFQDELNSHRWASNNSIFADVGMDYSLVAELTKKNGEPGFEWLENAQDYSRMGRLPDYKDRRALGGNPCFRGSTRIAVADGRNSVTLKQLADEGKDVPVYSFNLETNKVEIKWGRNPRLTRKDSPLVRVHFEGGTYVDCTPNHRWILRDGSWKYAENLSPGDSLPRFTKRQDLMKVGGKSYWRISCDPFSEKNRVFEHRLIAEFFDPATKQKLYDENKQNGWCKGGLVVHHKDYNSLNNSPDNLEWMTFKDHAAFHAQNDKSGENNGMYGRSHSDETKRKIGDQTLQRTADPEFRDKLSKSHTPEERAESSHRMVELKKEWDKKYYLDQEATTDLETVWIGERMFAKKSCEVCGSEFVVAWGKRDRVHCSQECSIAWLADMEKRKANHRLYFQDKQKQTLHDQVMVYKDLQQSLDRDPMKKEWEAECKSRGVSYRIRDGAAGKGCSNPYALQSYKDLKQRAQDYNCRVEKVEILSFTEDVYCLTVDDNHTMVVIPEGVETDKSYTGIHTFQCLEQTLEDRELCCLVETFPSRHENYEDYEKTLKYAYLYAKSVTLIPTHSERTNAVMMRNRRIGCSMSGIVQAMKRHGRRQFFTWCDQGYNYLENLDDIYSEWLCVPKSIKKTSVKPSGTISLLPGVTPGIHYPHSRFYIRRIRLQKGHSIEKVLSACGYPIEDDVYSPNTVVVEFPVEEKHFDRAKDQVSMWEQLENAAQMQTYWADNQVSITVTFKEDEADHIKYALELYETRLKGVSFLPLENHGYRQAPYEAIDEEEYNRRCTAIRSDDLPKMLQSFSTHDSEEKYCDGDVCIIK